MNAPYQSHSETSHEAAISMNPHLNRLESLVLLVLRGLPSQQGSDEQIANEMPHDVKESTTRARRIRLTQLGLIEDSGTTVKGSSGRPMTVWRLKSPSVSGVLDAGE